MFFLVKTRNGRSGSLVNHFKRPVQLYATDQVLVTFLAKKKKKKVLEYERNFENKTKLLAQIDSNEPWINFVIILSIQFIYLVSQAFISGRNTATRREPIIINPSPMRGKGQPQHRELRALLFSNSV